MKNQSSSVWFRVKIICLILGSLILFESTIVQSKSLQSLRETGAALYSQLLKFKNEKDFILNGFGYSNSMNKYENWRKEVNALKKECELELAKLPTPQQKIESEVFTLSNATTELNNLARRYATRGGKENNYMKKMRIELDKEFKSKTYSNKDVSEKISYSIINDQSYTNVKRSVDVRLKNRITIEQLTSLAHEINNLNKKSFKRTFILYYLPDMKVDAGAWASTHFNPNLKVEILGATIEEVQKLMEPIARNNNQKLIGNYFKDRGFKSRISIFKENGKIFKQDVALDGSQGIQEFKGSQTSQGLRLDEIEGNDYSEFYLINNDGNLESRDDQGLIETLKKIK